MRVIALGVVGHLVEWCIKENVSVGGIGDNEVEGCIAGSDDRDWAFDYVCAVEVGQVAFLTKGLELRYNIWPEIVARGFKVDKEDQSL